MVAQTEFEILNGIVLIQKMYHCVLLQFSGRAEHSESKFLKILIPQEVFLF